LAEGGDDWRHLQSVCPLNTCFQGALLSLPADLMVRKSKPKSHKQPDWTDSYLDVNNPHIAQPSRSGSRIGPGPSLFGKLARVWKSANHGAVQQPHTTTETDSVSTASSGRASSLANTAQESPSMPRLSQRQEEAPTTPRRSHRSWERQASSNAGGVMPLLLAEESDLHSGTFSPPMAPTPSLSAIHTPTFESRSFGSPLTTEGRNEQSSHMVQSGAKAITNTSHISEAGLLPRVFRPGNEDLQQETLLTDLDASSSLAVLNSNGTLVDNMKAELGELRKQVHGLQGEIQSLRREQGALKGVLRFCSGGKIPVDFDGNRDAGRRPSDFLAQLVSSQPRQVASTNVDVTVSRPTETTPRADCCGRENWPLMVQGGALDELATSTVTKLRHGFRMKRASRDNAGSDCSAMGAAVGADGFLDALWGTCMRAKRELTLDSAEDVNDLLEDAMQGRSRSGSTAGIADATNACKAAIPNHNSVTFSCPTSSESSIGSSTSSSAATSANESSAGGLANHRNNEEASLEGLLPQDSQACFTNSQAGFTDMSDGAPLLDGAPSSAVGGFVSMLSRRGTMRVLRQCGLGLGESVIWVASDEDVPPGQIGEVLGCSPAGVLVRFPGGTWYFSPNELVKVPQSSSTSGRVSTSNDGWPEQAASTENAHPGAVVAERGEVAQAITASRAVSAASTKEYVAAEAAAGVDLRSSVGSLQAGVSSGWRRLNGHINPAVEESSKAEATVEGGGDGSCSSSANSWHPLQQQGIKPDGLGHSAGVLLLPFPELAQIQGGRPVACQ